MLNNLITIENIRNWYESKNWTDEMVEKAIELGFITDDDFTKIKANIEAKKQSILDAQKAEEDRIEAEKQAEIDRQAELEKSMTDEPVEDNTEDTDTTG
ncbi:XkdX family protein [Companilactobacillus allii]|uniref:XkdX family protein n=1 Tax=Companilactobacillus allii TaxID=1847728 RepID=A0A1P8Q5J6_9LACO|nr:XkdX family protein [Companilactobacillus allii]APX73105.1 hypothetical protein BTM29_11325 [Companilactobacillus allii]USQ67906.1 XkdX family protein [Companilactobacillus allii]